MSEIVPIVTTGVVGALSGILGTYVLAKRIFSDDKIIEKVDVILHEVSENAEMQKRIYLLGGLIGKGIRDGTGLSNIVPKKKGGFEGIIMELIGGWIGSKLPSGAQEVIPPQEQRAIQERW
jgi:hypothetical protein